MDELVLIINRSGNKYEVTRKRAEEMVKNGDIKHTDIYNIETESMTETEYSETKTKKGAKKEEEATEPKKL